MIEIKRIHQSNKEDINIPNQPFLIFGRMVPHLDHGCWSYTVEKLDDGSEMCFPDENYNYEEMKADSVFLGAYDGEKCVGLAVLRRGFLKYMYLYDLKVNKEYRRCGVGRKLIAEANNAALADGYRGIYTVGQDNNLAACLFYIKNGHNLLARIMLN